MADVKGDLSVKNKFDVRNNARFFKGVDVPYFEAIDQKDPGILGGASVAGTFVARDLTLLIQNDFATSVSLTGTAGSGADFTLPPGEYYIEASAPAFNCGSHMARLADVTDESGTRAPTVIQGTVEYTPNVGLTPPSGDESIQTRSQVTGRFSVARDTRFEIQTAVEVADASEGFGAGASFTGGDFYHIAFYNVYTIVKIWQIRDDS